ncbi:Not1 N-terminal domain, CCR4-Not complex component-domain-containing protein [Exophiala viscosa]|uniref:General negative regulator of transcription subunit n=1 Tax=Exophiala viscosa TaxID=2486360 RepID=A0AAN6IAU4_9EURO|nr:Not1 N-terminal domain, CCR4-Not complex component-domain-containing protein [Exophiala viscosa]KAI1620835.1 Not1 N-terminal domain, CCR4-Not complex component-domain-containing protein [Exophiala viscosa]
MSMASRKTQQEIDKTFKKVDEGIQAFEGIYEKIYTSNNAAQKDKLEDNLKKEIKKLQRSRDQIKTWAAGNEIKDKSALLEQRKRIEKCMEIFKAVEKEMKTKAFSKEGLSQNTKLDPKEKEREELCDFLSDQLDEVNRILIEELEPEAGNIQTALKKKQKDNSKADRLAELESMTDTYKWHESRLQLLLRSLQNGNVDNDAVAAIKSEIEDVVRDGKEPDFDAEAYEGIYDDCNLDSEEAQFGLNNEGERMSSQDAQSVQEEPEPDPNTVKKTKVEHIPARRPSTQLKSPLPALATLNTMPPPPPIPKDTTMKPAPLPNRPPGETLKYASAAAAAAASDKSGVGIAPLPPPIGVSPSPGTSHPLPAPVRTSAEPSPASVPAQPVEETASPAPVAASMDGSTSQEQSSHSKSPTLSSASAPGASVQSSIPATPAMETSEAVQEPVIADELPTTNGDAHEDPSVVESIYHLPPGLQDLLDSFETTKNRAAQPPSQLARLLQASQDTCPEPSDSDRPQHYRPTLKYNTPAHYPQDVLPIFDDPALYDNQRLETDTLFYIFYYRQNTYQQWLAARALKNQSWRFHKQYQTWFQRHEEPKQITEEYEQGTYRFFDYESTWMNRRKADFKFVYKFLEDDL